jgi:pentatricopeptide repeat protein
MLPRAATHRFLRSSRQKASEFTQANNLMAVKSRFFGLEQRNVAVAIDDAEYISSAFFLLRLPPLTTKARSFSTTATNKVIKVVANYKPARTGDFDRNVFTYLKMCKAYLASNGTSKLPSAKSLDAAILSYKRGLQLPISIMEISLEIERKHRKGFVTPKKVRKFLLALLQQNSSDDLAAISKLLEMLQHFDYLQPSTVVYGKILTAYAKLKTQEGLRFMETVLDRLVKTSSNRLTRDHYNMLLNAYVGTLHGSAVIPIQNAMEQMTNVARRRNNPRLRPNSVSFAALVSALVKRGNHGYEEDVQKILIAMKFFLQDESNATSKQDLPVNSQISASATSKQDLPVSTQVSASPTLDNTQSLESKESVTTLEAKRQSFDSIVNPRTEQYNSMIKHLIDNKQFGEALLLFRQMLTRCDSKRQPCLPDQETLDLFEFNFEKFSNPWLAGFLLQSSTNAQHRTTASSNSPQHRSTASSNNPPCNLDALKLPVTQTPHHGQHNLDASDLTKPRNDRKTSNYISPSTESDIVSYDSKTNITNDAATSLQQRNATERKNGLAALRGLALDSPDVVKNAESILETITQPDLECFSAVLSIYADRGEQMKASYLVHCMETDFRLSKNLLCKPDASSYRAILGAILNAQTQPNVKVAEAVTSLFSAPDTSTYNLLIAIYGKAGRLDDAVAVVDQMQADFSSGHNLQCNPNIISFAAVLYAFAVSGAAQEASEFLQSLYGQCVMDSTQPRMRVNGYSGFDEIDSATFLLTALRRSKKNSAALIKAKEIVQLLDNRTLRGYMENVFVNFDRQEVEEREAH